MMEECGGLRMEEFMNPGPAALTNQNQAVTLCPRRPYYTLGISDSESLISWRECGRM